MISIIVAYDDKRGIGKDNKLMWNIKSDLQYFKKVTTGRNVLMGSKTFASIGRLLPNRHNIIMTRNEFLQIPGAQMCNDINEIISKYQHSDNELFICGGADIYEQFLPYTKRLYITEVAGDYDCDVCFPKWDDKEFNLVFTRELEPGVVVKQYFRKEK